MEEMGIADYLICLLRNLYAGQEATVRIGPGTTDWFQIGKGVCQGWLWLTMPGRGPRFPGGRNSPGLPRSYSQTARAALSAQIYGAGSVWA